MADVLFSLLRLSSKMECDLAAALQQREFLGKRDAPGRVFVAGCLAGAPESLAFLTGGVGVPAANTARLLPTDRPLGLSEDTLIILPTCVTGFSIAIVVEPPPSRLRAL